MAEEKLSVEILTPDAVTEKAESIGVKKAKNTAMTTLMLGILAGVFIAMAGEFYTMTVFDSALGYSITKLLGGITFCLGLVLVVITGAELFTGNTLLVIAFMTSKISMAQLLRNWLLVYVGNFIGATSVALLVFLSNQWMVHDYGFGIEAVKIGVTKLSNPFWVALVRGILANVFVVLGVWMSYAGRSLTDKFFAILLPVSAFVASGFEHSIANMYFIPLALLLKGQAAIQNAVHADLNVLTWSNFVINNLIPVTIGNIIGGSILVGLAYWFVYLYKRV